MRAATTSARTAVMCLCVTLVVGMVSAVNLAIPSLHTSALHPSATEVVWVVDGYVAVFACLLIPAGALADRWGRKGVLVSGMLVFALGSAICALAPQVQFLIAGRMLSGAGAAAVLPTTLALLIADADAGQRPRLISVWASMTGLAAVLGNVGGGAAIELGTWRSLFVCVVPLSAAAAGLVALVAPVVPRHRRPVDPLGALLLTGGIVALLFGITAGPQTGWTSAEVLAGTGVAVALLACWTWHGLRSEHPMLSPRLFAIPAVRSSALGLALLFVGMFGVFYVNGQFLQYAQGCSPFGAGVRLLPMAAALLLAPRCGVAVERLLGRRWTVAAGVAVQAAGLLVLSTVDRTSPYPLYAAGAGLAAAGCGLATPLLSHGMVSALPAEQAGVGSGLQSLARELGSALGIALAGSLITALFTADSPTPGASTVAAALRTTTAPEQRLAVVDHFTASLDTTMLTLAGFALLAGAFVVAWFPRQAAPPGGRAAERAPEVADRSGP